MKLLRRKETKTRMLILSKLVFEDDEGTANAAMAIIASTAHDEVRKLTQNMPLFYLYISSEF
tara:strand:+ start:274 stop:459 length:186 start_codon:yes stop_codon:yes gene_type:complete